ncbi:g375 [Coccomyxa viridis]|uniref:G375 protein n=1 Tax=Coccomyxa viridis TaxID=1274662 RepID=A0ABP1FKS0_9CHLO
MLEILYLAVSVLPKPRAVQPAAPEATAAAATEGAPGVTENFQENVSTHSARAASAWMLPWERRQMDGAATPLRTWEKLYWGIFVAGFSAFLFSRLYRSQPPDPKIDEEKEAKKRERARLLLAGHSMAEDDDPFEGLTPQEIEQYVQKETAGASHTDPFEGMSPEEINEYMAKHGSIQPAA